MTDPQASSPAQSGPPSKRKPRGGKIVIVVTAIGAIAAAIATAGGSINDAYKNWKDVVANLSEICTSHQGICRSLLLSRILDGKPSVTFPALKPNVTEYVVKPDEQRMIFDTLYLPKGFTLRVDPGIKSLDWTVKTIKIEEDATFDLSAPDRKPKRAPDGPAPPRQADYCTQGAPGAAGSPGTQGRPGVNLTLRDVSAIENGGSLWIRTDGGPGGDGGTGGGGQQGGGADRRFIGPHCGAGGGGRGGDGGAAGAGGLTSDVSIIFKGSESSRVIRENAEGCAPSKRPPSARSNSGVIVIWGAVGCSGQPGGRGQDGGAG